MNGVMVLTNDRLKYIGVNGIEIEMETEIKNVKEICVDREGRVVVVDSDANIHYYI